MFSLISYLFPSCNRRKVIAIDSNAIHRKIDDSNYFKNNDVKTVCTFDDNSLDKSIEFITEHLSPIEKLIAEEMIRCKKTSFHLRYRFSNYDKELYLVYIRPYAFDENIKYNNPIKIDIMIENEAYVCSTFQEYMDMREGNVYDYHNWELCNKWDIQNALKKN